MTKQSTPLVTFALFSYNQEKYVRAAVEGALAQSYENLEIIISDDCSTDNTFLIIAEEVSKYGGTHRVHLNRNEKNLGIGAHVSKVFNMANGELIVAAAGDDVSLPLRTVKLTTKWLEVGRPSCICSEMIIINDIGKRLKDNEMMHFDGIRKGTIKPNMIIERYLKDDKFWICGCSAAWSKKTWNMFGKMGQNTATEDIVMSFRAGLYGGFYILSDKLVHYRKHDENLSFAIKNTRRRSFRENSSQAIKLIEHSHYITLDNKKDLETANNHSIIEINDYHRLKDHIEQKLARLEIAKEWWNYSFFRKIQYWNSSPFRSKLLRLLSLFGVGLYQAFKYGSHLLKYYLNQFRK